MYEKTNVSCGRLGGWMSERLGEYGGREGRRGVLVS